MGRNFTGLIKKNAGILNHCLFLCPVLILLFNAALDLFLSIKRYFEPGNKALRLTSLIGGKGEHYTHHSLGKVNWRVRECFRVFI